MKKIISLVLIVACFFMTKAEVDAASVNMYLVIREQDVLILDITVSEKIDLVKSTDSESLNVSALVIKNNMSNNRVRIDSIAVSLEKAFTLVAMDTDFTKKDSMGKIAFSYGQHDFSNGKLSPTDILIDKNGEFSVELQSKIGPVTEIMTDINIGSVILTVSMI